MPQLKISSERAAEYHSKIYVFQAEPEATTQHASLHDIYINQTALIRSKLGIYLYCAKEYLKICDS